MDCEKTGKLIYTLRKQSNLTQKQLADALNISDKAVSKWERGLGCPDVSLLVELSALLGTGIEEILKGRMAMQDIVGGNMKKLKFYFCPNCFNTLTAFGEASISCCGKKIECLTPKKADDAHMLNIETIEDEYFITANHTMTKEHFISFSALVTGDKIHMIKHYPEWDMQTYIPKLGHGYLYWHCTNHGLFYKII